MSWPLLAGVRATARCARRAARRGARDPRRRLRLPQHQRLRCAGVGFQDGAREEIPAAGWCCTGRPAERFDLDWAFLAAIGAQECHHGSCCGRQRLRLRGADADRRAPHTARAAPVAGRRCGSALGRRRPRRSHRGQRPGRRDLHRRADPAIGEGRTPSRGQLRRVPRGGVSLLRRLRRRRLAVRRSGHGTRRPLRLPGAGGPPRPNDSAPVAALERLAAARLSLAGRRRRRAFGAVVRATRSAASRRCCPLPWRTARGRSSATHGSSTTSCGWRAATRSRVTACFAIHSHGGEHPWARRPTSSPPAAGRGSRRPSASRATPAGARRARRPGCRTAVRAAAVSVHRLQRLPRSRRPRPLPSVRRRAASAPLLADLGVGRSTRAPAAHRVLRAVVDRRLRPHPGGLSGGHGWFQARFAIRFPLWFQRARSRRAPAGSRHRLRACGRLLVAADDRGAGPRRRMEALVRHGGRRPRVRRSAVSVQRLQRLPRSRGPRPLRLRRRRAPAPLLADLGLPRAAREPAADGVLRAELGRHLHPGNPRSLTVTRRMGSRSRGRLKGSLLESLSGSLFASFPASLSRSLPARRRLAGIADAPGRSGGMAGGEISIKINLSRPGGRCGA